MRATFFDPDTNRRAAELLNRILGITCSLAGVLFLLAWSMGTVEQLGKDGTGLGLIGAFWIGPAGPLFLLAERAWRCQWKFRWLIQVLPPVYPVAFIALLAVLSV